MISIIVPVYNAENYLVECIDSILQQTYQDIELILVNDGSKDSSLEICKSYEGQHVIVIDKPNGGVSSARNAGLNIAKGEYIAFVDSDDLLPKDAIKKLYDVVFKEEVDAAIGPFQYLYGDKCQPHALRLNAGLYSYDSLLSHFLDDGTLSGFLIGSACAALYKGKIVKENNIRFAENLKNNEDGLFNFEFALHADRVVVINDIVYTYRQEQNNSKCIRKNEDFGKKVFDYLDNMQWDKDNYYYEIQKQRRNVTLAWWNIIHHYNDYTFIAAVKYIDTVLDSDKVRLGVKFMCPSKMNVIKKFFFYLIKYHMSFPMYMSLKYIVPVLQTKIRR